MSKVVEIFFHERSPFAIFDNIFRISVRCLPLQEPIPKIGTHNYQPGKSIFEHSNAEDLLKKYSGKGKPVRGNFGEPGYQEIINFEEFIGYNICDQTGEKIPTTWGKIHYSKNGAHIVPTRPKQ
ncbi:polymorphic toxin type 50 domain-containing protein [Candidatus Protochlamydia phocaeensis]|uniref:polymorphic toxin type 50 domain-containing protein n=1 Tax=Candidatus Protochlamydia phocaeensis TaxID=1414722 RepID=UPI0018968DC1|nr:polymorphic toxin type 50 domain-containing protein [Candidatus Protochlamydia phocaeensis]